MKKLLLSLLLLSASCGLLAHPVESDQARDVAATFLATMGHPGVAKLTQVDAPFDEFYIFNAEGGGFVLVAGDDCVHPILGYSPTGLFVAHQLPAHIREWLDAYEGEIARIKRLGQGKRAADATPDIVAAEWDRLASGLPLDATLTTSVSPLLTTTWNQSPRYNAQCPLDTNTNSLSVTGCTATATAQIMKYWNHPATGYGSHSFQGNYGPLSADFGATSYDWAHMPNSLSYSSSQTEINAVAQLMYHVGVAVEMDYSSSGSGAATIGSAPSAQSALATYFKYAPNMVAVHRSSSDDSTHAAILRAELNQSRPILYTGYGSGGHAFVFDGYNTLGQFHINWGWGSYCDGYYLVGALNPAPGGIGGNSTSSYNNGNTALIGIRPNPSFGSGGTVTVRKVGGTSACTVAGSGTYSFGDAVTLSASAPSGYRFEKWIDNSQDNPRTFVMNGGNFTFTASFENLGYDIISHCGNKGNITSFGFGDAGLDKYWGIKLPAAALTVGRVLTAVEFYSVGAGSYDVTVYKGTNSPTTAVFTTTVQVTSQSDGWVLVELPQGYAVESGTSLWLTLHNTDVLYPAAVSSSSGNADGFLWGTSFTPLSYWDECTAMIRGHFGDPGSVCGDGYTADTSAVACDSYTWRGITYTASAAPTCTLTASNGCDSVVTLHLTIAHGTYNNISARTCNRYIWHGNTFTASGNYTYAYNNSYGCASSDTLHLVINKGTFASTTASGCDRYTWHGDSYTVGGNYVYNYNNANGCASSDTLHLTIYHGTHNAVWATACDRYAWHGTLYTVEGNHTYPYSDAHGCASTDTLHLTLHHGTHNATTATACDRYLWNNTTYSSTGRKIYSYINAEGCVSADTLYLTVNRSSSGVDTVTACDSYEWHGTVYTSSTSTPRYIGTAANGCDSTVTLHLTVGHSQRSHEYLTHCGPYTWPLTGKSYNKSGLKFNKGTTPEGCPIRDTLELTVIDRYHSYTEVENCGPYTWDKTGQTYNKSGLKFFKGTADDGCPVRDTLNLTVTDRIHSYTEVTSCGPYTWQLTGQTYNKSGLKFNKGTAPNGCLIRDTLKLTVTDRYHSYSEVTHCGPYTWELTGQTYNKSGLKFNKGTAADGCPIRDTLKLTVVTKWSSHDTVVSCDGAYTWDKTGQTYKKSGMKFFKGVAEDGCPIRDTLYVIIGQSEHSYAEVTSYGPYTWDLTGKTYNKSGLKFNKTTNADGCPVRDTLMLTVLEPNAGAESYEYEIAENESPIEAPATGAEMTEVAESQLSTLNSLKVYPNPTSGRVQINVTEAEKVEVLDLVGRLVAVYENTNTLDLTNLADGTYTLRITLAEGVALRKVVKR